jgi:hypothetical protein
MKQLMSGILVGMLGMTMAFAQPIIVVLGNHPDALILKHRIAYYLDQLDVGENIHLSLSFSNSMPDPLQGMTFCLNSPPPPAYQIIRIWMNARLKKSELDFALAHEMVHVKQ